VSAFSEANADEVDAGDGTRYQQSELQPLPVSAFRAPVAAYRHYAIAQSRAMAVPVARLLAAVRRGDRAGAKRDWSSAYDRYLLLGAAYGALCDLDVAIDGGAGGLKGGVKDPHFTGLHRVEHDLWRGVPTARIVPYAARLRRDVAKLPHALAVLEITPLDYATRAHEILEDAQRDQLSGRAAKWSGEGLLATAAGLQATDRVLKTLDPVLSGRESTQQNVATQLGPLRRELASLRAAHHGTYPPLSALTERRRARVNGALGTALEALSLVPGTLETTRIPTVKALP
jgi:iron uptake system EfeUOB component EfeO/EfeM